MQRLIIEYKKHNQSRFIWLNKNIKSFYFIGHSTFSDFYLSSEWRNEFNLLIYSIDTHWYVKDARMQSNQPSQILTKDGLFFQHPQSGEQLNIFIHHHELFKKNPILQNEQKLLYIKRYKNKIIDVTQIKPNDNHYVTQTIDLNQISSLVFEQKVNIKKYIAGFIVAMSTLIFIITTSTNNRPIVINETKKYNQIQLMRQPVRQSLPVSQTKQVASNRAQQSNKTKSQNTRHFRFGNYFQRMNKPKVIQIQNQQSPQSHSLLAMNSMSAMGNQIESLSSKAEGLLQSENFKERGRNIQSLSTIDQTQLNLKGHLKIIDNQTEITGGLDKSIIQEHIQTHLGQILYCYERQLSVTPDLNGKLNVKFIINSQGKIDTVEFTDNSLKNLEVEKCMQQQIARWSFPQPKNGTKVQVSYPFLFKSLK